MSTPTLGQRVTFTHSLHRRHSDQGHFWEALHAWNLDGVDGSRDGIVVGVRTLSDGSAELVDSADGWSSQVAYFQSRTFRAYLVAYDLRRKPVYVLPKHTTTTEGN